MLLQYFPLDWGSKAPLNDHHLFNSLILSSLASTEIQQVTDTQMASSGRVLQRLLERPNPVMTPVTCQWLVPNMRGFDDFRRVLEASNLAEAHGGADEGPVSNTSTQNTNEMPQSAFGVDAMSGLRSRTDTETDIGPALNTSTQDANAMPSATSGVDAMSKYHSTSPDPTSSTTYIDPIASDRGPTLNTSAQDANAMPSSVSGIDAMLQQHPPTDLAMSSEQPIGKHEISLFLAATETFSLKNTNCTIKDSLTRFKAIIEEAKTRGIPVRAYISVALGCPYEGPRTSFGDVADLAVQLLNFGADEISVADTTGMGTASKTKTLLSTLSVAGVPVEKMALHFHDTYGQALVNAFVGVEHGVRTFDGAVAGLGGCPFSPGATGNVATEDLVRCFEGTGMDTGVDIEELAKVGDWISSEVERANESRAGKAFLSKMKRDVS